MTNNTEMHGELVASGWRVDVAGRWRSPDPTDTGRYSLSTAWRAHTEPTDPKETSE